MIVLIIAKRFESEKNRTFQIKNHFSSFFDIKLRLFDWSIHMLLECWETKLYVEIGIVENDVDYIID